MSETAKPGAPPPPKPLGHPSDLIRRGAKDPSPLGALTFVGLRALDPILQHRLLLPASQGGWGASLLHTVGLASIFAPGPYGAAGAVPDAVAHASSGVLVAMSALAAAKHAVWVVLIREEEISPGAAAGVAAYNSFMNAVDALLFLYPGASSALSRPLLGDLVPGEGSWWAALPLVTVLGAALFVGGLGVELASEVQRAMFKRGSRKGEAAVMPCRTGLWGVVRHPNYAGYAAWRCGMGLAAFGWTGGALMLAIQAQHFVRTSVPLLEGYCAERYGEQWTMYQRDVKWSLLPGVW